MQVVGIKLLHQFAAANPAARSWLRNWIADTQNARWATPHDIRQRYNSVSFLAKNRTVFNVKGNDYRMVTTVAYQTQIVVVNWIGTHSEYSKINWESAKDETHRS